MVKYGTQLSSLDKIKYPGNKTIQGKRTPTKHVILHSTCDETADAIKSLT